MRKLFGTIFLAFILVLAACGGDSNTDTNNSDNDGNVESSNNENGNSEDNSESNDNSANGSGDVDERIATIQAMGETEESGGIEATQIDIGKTVLESDDIKITLSHAIHELDHMFGTESYELNFSIDNARDFYNIFVYIDAISIDGVALDDMSGDYEESSRVHETTDYGHVVNVKATDGELPILDGSIEVSYRIHNGQNYEVDYEDVAKIDL